MDFDEKRKFKRVKICYPISYSCIDLADTIVFENSGYALDISQGGLRLGITNIISTDKIMLIANDYKRTQIEIKGNVVWCKKIGAGEYQTGIKFMGNHESNVSFVTEVVRAYHYQKEQDNIGKAISQSTSAA
jgi:hypothetical protein